jgi:hypothetical protein
MGCVFMCASYTALPNYRTPMAVEIRTIHVKSYKVKGYTVKAYSYKRAFTVKNPGAKKPRARPKKY